jgi:hypothetical protein
MRKVEKLTVFLDLTRHAKVKAVADAEMCITVDLANRILNDAIDKLSPKEMRAIVRRTQSIRRTLIAIIERGKRGQRGA